MAKKLKLREKMVLVAQALGGVEIDSRSGKYRTFQRPNNEKLLFVGKAGALRSGTCASKSFDISRMPAVKKLLAGIVG